MFGFTVGAAMVSNARSAETNIIKGSEEMSRGNNSGGVTLSTDANLDDNQSKETEKLEYLNNTQKSKIEFVIKNSTKPPESTMSYCEASMAKIIVLLKDNEGGSSVTNSGSSSILSETVLKRVDDGMPVVVYQILTADHVVSSENPRLTPSEVILFPGNHQEQDYRYRVFSYSGLKDESGMPQDIGILTVVGFYRQAKIGEENFAPLPLSQVKVPDISLLGKYITASYPLSGGPSLVDSEFVGFTKTSKGNRLLTMDPTDNTGNIESGSSGGPVCDPEGNLIGVVYGYDKKWDDIFWVEEVQKNTAEVTLKELDKVKKQLLDYGVR